MATHVKQRIGEIDVVVLTEAIDKVDGTGRWPAGTTGTVVSDHGEVKLLEISDEQGQMRDLISVPVEKLKLVTKYS
jgi:hypothetical protein